MKQFFRIFRFELDNYVKNKVFVGVTLFLVIAIVAVMFAPRVIELFDEKEPEADMGGYIEESPDIEGDVADLPSGEGAVMLVRSPEGVDVTELFERSFYDYDVQKTEESVEKIKEKISSGDAECAFVLESLTEYTYYVNNLSMYDFNASVADEMLTAAYRVSALSEAGVSAEAATEIMSVYTIGNVEKLGVDQMENYWYTYIMIFALYMVIMLYGQMVATGVATEKSSRAMELLITSAKPVAMMFGKVLAGCLAGLMQIVFIFGAAILSYRINSSYWGENPIVESIFAMPPYLLGYMVVFFILGFLLFAFLYGAMGSTASKLEDVSTSIMPITLCFVAGFVVVMMSFSTGEVDSLLMKVCSFVPFTSSMAMFTRIAMSTVPWYEIVASVGILGVSVVLIGIAAAKIYKVGVLLYGTPPKPMAIIKAVFFK